MRKSLATDGESLLLKPDRVFDSVRRSSFEVQPYRCHKLRQIRQISKFL